MESEFSWKHSFSLWHWIPDGVWGSVPIIADLLEKQVAICRESSIQPLSCAVGPCDLHRFPFPSVLDKPRKLWVSFTGSNPSGLFSLLLSLLPSNLGHSPVREAWAIFTNASGTAYVSLCLRRDNFFFCQSRPQVDSESLGLGDGQYH